jgi:hypothetical protein
MAGFAVRTLAVLALAAGAACWGETTEEDLRVFTEHPRLFLQARRLRLLQRERARQSLRWQQFQALMEGKAQMPEPGFALALYARVSGESSYCREAIRWALGPASDLRQLALVFDWCQPDLSDGQSQSLASKLEQGIVAASRRPGVAPVRDRLLAAVTLAGYRQEVSERELRFVVEKWWRGEIVPAIDGRRDALPRDDALALFEILHAVRDNLNIDLRESIPDFFRSLPAVRLLSYYPSPYPAAENEYYIPAARGGGEPDLRRAALSRAADLSLVAYDSNTRESQFLQGWLMRDRALMRSPFGAPYELLWANPYLPGLSHYHAPLLFHDERLGRLFVRSSWDEDATWLGYGDGELQVFTKDGLRLIKQQPASKPIRLGEVAVIETSGASTLRVEAPDVWHVFLLGLRPGASYELKVAEAKPVQKTADPGGIIHVPVEPQASIVVRLRELPPRGNGPLSSTNP